MGYFDNNTWVRFLLDLIFFVVFWFVSFTILWVLFIEWELFGGGLWIGQESGMIL